MKASRNVGILTLHPIPLLTLDRPACKRCGAQLDAIQGLHGTVFSCRPCAYRKPRRQRKAVA